MGHEAPSTSLKHRPFALPLLPFLFLQGTPRRSTKHFPLRSMSLLSLALLFLLFLAELVITLLALLRHVLVTQRFVVAPSFYGKIDLLDSLVGFRLLEIYPSVVPVYRRGRLQENSAC